MSLLTEVEEFLRTTDEWDINWIDAYYNILSKDFIREFKHHFIHQEENVIIFIWHKYGDKFVEEIFGREPFRKLRNRIEFRNDI